MFSGKSFNEKFLLTRKYYDFARAINCTRKLTCVCANACACDRTHLREQQYVVFKSQEFPQIKHTSHFLKNEVQIFHDGL